MHIKSKSFVYIATRMASRFRTELAQAFARNGFANVTPDYFIVMEWLAEEDNVSIKLLAKRTSKDTASLSRILDGMERNDLAQRVTNATDKRSYQIILTKYAREILENLRNIEQETLQKASAGLNPIEVKELIRMIDHLYNNLDE